MAYTLPTFNLLCNVYTWVAAPGPLVVPRLSPACNLQCSRRVNAADPGYFDEDLRTLSMWLLLPPLTDVRPWYCYFDGSGGQDIVECPAGSGRIYLVGGVDDVGKGFANEFRVAQLMPCAHYGLWPSPIP